MIVPKGFMAISIAELYSKQLPKEDWIIEGLLTRKNVGFMIGPSKRGKSWLMLDAAWSLAEGKAIWGIPELRPSRAMRTVYFTQEDTESNIQDRIRKHVDVGHRTLNNGVTVVPKDLSMKLDTSNGIRLIKNELDSVVKSGQIDLVVFDPMRRIHNGDENDSSHIAKLWAVLDAIHNDYNCATLIVHHTKKPPEDKTGYDPTDPYQGRGSGDIFGGGDAFVMVVPGPMSPDKKSWRRVSAHFESKRGEPIAPAELQISLIDGSVSCLSRQ